MIKEYNQILSKYKNEFGGEEIKLIDELYYPELAEELVLDNQFFDVLDHFKKLYHERKSDYIS